jgi:hypothetical protein
MIEERGNFWDAPATYRCVTTNGVVRADGRAVMGKGIALEAVRYAASLRNPVDIPAALGVMLKSKGNHVQLLKPTNLISFPTKNDWRDQADLALIERSARELVRLINDLGLGPDARVVLPKPGCTNGGLLWEDVRAMLAPILSDKRFVVIIGQK